MADREVTETPQEIPEIPKVLEQTMLFALDEAKSKMEQGADVVPFTVLTVKDNLFIESHPGDSADECFADAQHTVEGARGADAYAFCYDGYVELDDATRDAIIAEGGVPGEDEGHAICYLYTTGEKKTDGTTDDTDDGKLSVAEDIVFDSDPAYVGKAPNFMSKLKEPSSYSADDIAAKYQDDFDESDFEDE